MKNLSKSIAGTAFFWLVDERRPIALAGTRSDLRFRFEQSVLGAPLHTVRPAATDVVAWSSRSVSGSTRHSPCASKTRSHPHSPTLVAGNPAIWASNTFFRNFPQIEEILRISLKKERMNSFASFSFTELTDLHRRKSKVARTGVARHHGGDVEDDC